MSGKKGRSGRQKRAIELARARGKDDALSYVRRRLDELLEVLVEKGAAGDKECAIYCVDRVLGRPRQELDQRLKAEPVPNASQYLAFMRTPEYAEALAAAQRESKEIEAEWSPTPWPERELSDSTRDISHDPVSEVDITAPFERDIAEGQEGDVTRELSVMTRDDADESTDNSAGPDG